jgi:hypothetical protein
LDFTPRRDPTGKDRTEDLLAEYDRREGSAFSDPAQNFYRRTQVAVELGGSTVDGWVYATNVGGHANVSGLSNSEASRRIIDATEETPGSPQTVLRLEDEYLAPPKQLRSEGALLRMAEQLDSATRALDDGDRTALAELARIEGWVRKNVDPYYDRYQPTRTYQKGAHYWEGVAYGLREIGATDQHVTNVMLGIRLWQAIARLRAEDAADRPVAPPTSPASVSIAPRGGRDPPS